MTELVRRIEWRVDVEPWPVERWRACTLTAVDEAHAQTLAKHRKFARITRITVTETADEIPLEP